MVLTHDQFGPALLNVAGIGLSLTLTVLCARQYRLSSRLLLRTVAVYLLSLAIGIGVVILDDLMR